MLKRFIKVCQRNLTNLPNLPCQNAINAINHNNKKQTRCPWYVNSKISCYCWFKYCDLVTKEHGRLFEHTFDEIAKIDNCTAVYAKITESKALKKISKRISNKNPEMLDIAKLL